MDNSFFNESTEQSRIKAAIVSKYFDAWATVITRQSHVGRIMYLDLFAGPGRYEDGTVSTPLLILRKAIADPILCQKLVAVFNDVNSDNTKALETAIEALPNVDQLANKPRVWNEEVGENMVKRFKTANLAPTLFFVDPWGYKGLSLGLVNAVVKDWACECVFFFNYNRINMGLPNALVTEHMNGLFGAEVADRLRGKLGHYSVAERELVIVESICEALNPDGRRFVLPFTFKNEAGNRTSHHLIFVSKSQTGYSIMKDIMANEGSKSEDGIPNFMYNPADKRFPVLFEYGRPLSDLEGMLLTDFIGQELTVKEIFARHNVGKPFVLKNYKAAIMSLESNWLVTTTRTDMNRKKGQCLDSATVKFME